MPSWPEAKKPKDSLVKINPVLFPSEKKNGKFDLQDLFSNPAKAFVFSEIFKSVDW